MSLWIVCSRPFASGDSSSHRNNLDLLLGTVLEQPKSRSNVEICESVFGWTFTLASSVVTARFASRSLLFPTSNLFTFSQAYLQAKRINKDASPKHQQQGCTTGEVDILTADYGGWPRNIVCK